MKIENLNVVELSNSELQSTNGGSWVSFGLGYLLGFLSETAEGQATVKALHLFH